MRRGLGFAFWKSLAGFGAVTGLPPLEGVNFTWTFQSGTPGNRTVVLTNPNDVNMDIVWVEFPSAHFTGPTPLTHTIPAHGYRNFTVSYDGDLSDDNTTGTYDSGAGPQALTGEAIGT